NSVDRFGIELLAQIDAADLRSDVLRERNHVEPGERCGAHGETSLTREFDRAPRVVHFERRQRGKIGGAIGGMGSFFLLIYQKHMDKSFGRLLARSKGYCTEPSDNGNLCQFSQTRSSNACLP